MVDQELHRGGWFSRTASINAVVRELGVASIHSPPRLEQQRMRQARQCARASSGPFHTVGRHPLDRARVEQIRIMSACR